MALRRAFALRHGLNILVCPHPLPLAAAAVCLSVCLSVTVCLSFCLSVFAASFSPPRLAASPPRNGHQPRRGPEQQPPPCSRATALCNPRSLPPQCHPTPHHPDALCRFRSVTERWESVVTRPAPPALLAGTRRRGSGVAGGGSLPDAARRPHHQ
eukprot:117505-Rhodomonas_salina.1